MTAPDPHLSRRDAERLLDTPAEHDHALGWALTAASAPGFPDELRREAAAVAAFHAARLAPPPASRSGFVSPSRLGSRAAARAVVATGAVVALTSGGFALANSAHLPHLPLLPDRASDRATESVAKTPGDGGSTSPGATSTSAAGPSSSATGPAGSPSGSAGSPGGSTGSTSGSSETPDQTTTPTPDYRGLCRAFQTAGRGGAGSSLDSAAFQALAAQAGGADRIATYCVDLIGPPKETGRPTDKPSPGRPTDKPSPGKPTDKPSPGKPTDKPSPGKPTDKPTPTDAPGGSGNSGSGNSGSGSSNSSGNGSSNSSGNGSSNSSGNGSSNGSGNGNGKGDTT